MLKVLLFIAATLYCIKSIVWVNVTWLQFKRVNIKISPFSQSGYIDGPVLNTFRTNLVVLPMVMEYMQYIFIALGLAGILGAVMLYVTDKVCGLLRLFCMFEYFTNNTFLLQSVYVCVSACAICERLRGSGFTWCWANVVWSLIVSTNVRFSLRTQMLKNPNALVIFLYHPTLTFCMSLDGLNCNICMICFTESHEKDNSISLTRGQHQLFIYAYSKTEITMIITIKNVCVWPDHT